MITLHLTNITREELLTAAIAGLEIEKRRLESRIQEIRIQLDGGGTLFYEFGQGYKVSEPKPGNRIMVRQQRVPFIRGDKTPKRTMSAAGRKAVAVAQKKRWAKFHKANKAA